MPGEVRPSVHPSGPGSGDGRAHPIVPAATYGATVTIEDIPCLKWPGMLHTKR
jgi:hypothetical protein